MCLSVCVVEVSGMRVLLVREKLLVLIWSRLWEPSGDLSPSGFKFATSQSWFLKSFISYGLVWNFWDGKKLEVFLKEGGHASGVHQRQRPNRMNVKAPSRELTMEGLRAGLRLLNDFWTKESSRDARVAWDPTFLGYKDLGLAVMLWTRVRAGSWTHLQMAMSQTCWIAETFIRNIHLISYLQNSSSVPCVWSKMNVLVLLKKKIKLLSKLFLIAFVVFIPVEWDTRDNLEMSEKDN